MTFRFDHNNLNVLDLERSVSFYREALGLQVLRRTDAADGSFSLVFLGDGQTGQKLELTWLRERTEPYDLGDNEIHLCFATDDYEAAHQKHADMGCICYENEEMGLYFISDSDGYWTEIVRA